MKAAEFQSYLEDQGCTVSGKGSTRYASKGDRSTQYGIVQGKVADTTIQSVCNQLGVSVPA